MANTLTNLIPELYSNLDVVSREMVGFIPAVTLDASVERAAVNQTVRVFQAPAASAADVSPAVSPPDTGDQTIGNKSIIINKSRGVRIRWTGDEERSLGPGAMAVRSAQIQQAIRTLVNEIEADLAAMRVYASRAAGTAGTTPFGTANDYTGASLARKILADNGAPMSDLQLVVDTTSGANIRGKQASAADAGTDSILRQGVLMDINGMMVRESAAVVSHTKGTNSSGAVNSAGYSVGSQTLTLASAGTGTIVAGDVVTFAGDTNQYVINTGDADVSNGGTIVLNEPGIRVAMSAANKVITTVANSVQNMAFSKSAIVLAQRLPVLPDGGDSADDMTIITDPRSGLSFEVSSYGEYRRRSWLISCAWGVSAIKPEHIALLLG